MVAMLYEVFAIPWSYEYYSEWNTIQKSIQGVEKKPLPHLLGVTNLILHDIEVPQIKHDNSLTRPLRDYTDADRVDVILTNPPFGAKIPIDDKNILNNDFFKR